MKAYLGDMLRTDRFSQHNITWEDKDARSSVKGPPSLRPCVSKVSENSVVGKTTRQFSLSFFFSHLLLCTGGGVVFLAEEIPQSEAQGSRALLWDGWICMLGQDPWLGRALLPASSSKPTTEGQTCLLLSSCLGDQNRPSSKHPAFRWLVECENSIEDWSWDE